MQQRISRPVSERNRFPRYFLPSLLLVVLFGRAGYADQVKLKIVAINDFHGHLQSSESFRAGPQSPDVPVGGIDVLAGYVEYLKAQNPYNVVVSAGDLIGASPLVSGLYHDEGTIETMNRLGLEISAVGNHEFDKGRQELLRMQSGGCFTGDKNTCRGAEVGMAVPFGGAKFQYLAANVFDEASGKTIFPAYMIKTYNGVPVAFIGVTLEGTPVTVRPGGIAGLRFAGEASTINALVRQLRAQGIQSVVVLIHQGGWQEVTKGTVDINSCEGELQGTPIEAIVNQLDDAVELVISGHTHQAYVCQIANSAGRKVPVTSAASFGRLLTDIDVTVDTTTKKVTSVTAQNIVVDRSNTKITADAGIKGLMDRYAALAAPIASRVVGSITADITRTTSAGRESPLGHLIADAQLEATRDSGAVVAFTNSGGIRGDLAYSSGAADAGERKVTYGELFTIQPFQQNLVTITLTGTQLQTLLEEQFKGCALDFPPGVIPPRSDQILQVSEGFTYAWNPAGATCNKVDAGSIKVNGLIVGPTRKYRVTVSSYLAEGGDRLYEFTHGMERVDGAQDVDALAAYFAKHHSVSPSRLDRIKISPQPNPD